MMIVSSFLLFLKPLFCLVLLFFRANFADVGVSRHTTGGGGAADQGSSDSSATRRLRHTRW